MTDLFHKFDVDNRSYDFQLVIPHLGVYGVAFPAASFWIQSFFFLLLQALLNVLIASVIYILVLRNQNSTQALLFAYGVICPFMLYLPHLLVPAFQLENVALICCLVGGFPSVLFFRCLEAAHKTLPLYASESFSNFLLYNAFTLQFTFDPKTYRPQKVSSSDLVASHLLFLRLFVECTILFNVLVPRSFQLFPLPEADNLWTWQHLVNNFVMALFTSRLLEAGSLGLGMLASMTFGLKILDFNDNPLFGSTSVSDFWGKRWNKVVGTCLRRGVYRPLRQNGVSSTLGALATFGASGLLHEFWLQLLTLRGGSTFVPQYGRHFVFFAWNGIALCGEHLLGHMIPTHSIPRALRTAFVIMLVLPIAHWFTDEFVAAQFYQDAAPGFPKILYLGPVQ